MKSNLLVVLLSLTFVSSALANNVNFDLNVNVGNKPRVVEPPPPPPRTTVVIEEEPEFIYPDPLGFYVAVGVPYDLYFLQNNYYLFRDGVWYRASNYRGPWVVTRLKHLPPGLRRHRIEQIRSYRDQEYVVYRRERDHYHGRHFRPDKEWKEERKEEHERWKEEKRAEKEERKRHKHKKHDDD